MRVDIFFGANRNLREFATSAFPCGQPPSCPQSPPPARAVLGRHHRQARRWVTAGARVRARPEGAQQRREALRRRRQCARRRFVGWRLGKRGGRADEATAHPRPPRKRMAHHPVSPHRGCAGPRAARKAGCSGSEKEKKESRPGGKTTRSARRAFVAVRRRTHLLPHPLHTPGASSNAPADSRPVNFIILMGGW